MLNKFVVSLPLQHLCKGPPYTLPPKIVALVSECHHMLGVTPESTEHLAERTSIRTRQTGGRWVSELNNSVAGIVDTPKGVEEGRGAERW